MWNGGQGDNFDIYVKMIGDSTALQLTKSSGTSHLGRPTWSPDGHRIAFSRCDATSAGIFVISLFGGSERKIAEVHSCSSDLDWSPDGKLLAVSDYDSEQEPEGIFLLSPETGGRRRLTRPVKPESDAQGKFSPDGKTVAFVRFHGPITHDLFVVPTLGGEPKRLTFTNRFFNGLTWAADGKEIIFTNQVGDENSLWRISAKGGTAQRVAEVSAVDASEPAMSRQGNRLAYRQVSVNTNVWQIRMPVAKGRWGAPGKLISSTRSQSGEQYSPDGKKIVFASNRSGTPQIWICDSDGSNPVQLTFMDAPDTGTPRWSPDGRFVVFDSTPTGNLGVYVINAEGGRAKPLVVDSHTNNTPSFSRDGRWVYFVSDRGGDYQIWKVSSDGGQPLQVSFHGVGWHPMESPDGKFLYYVKGPPPISSDTFGQLWRMPVGGGEESLVFNEPISSLYWAVTRSGIYFVDVSAKPHRVLKFLDGTTGRTTKIIELEREPSCCNQALAVSPDEHSIVYSQTDSVSTEIMLLENFR
jgi:Tol biopolymer transport system component